MGSLKDFAPHYSVVVEEIARLLASLDPTEPWPTNSELGGSLTGTRDDEYHSGMIEQAEEVLEVAIPMLAGVWEACNRDWSDYYTSGFDPARCPVNPYRAMGVSKCPCVPGDVMVFESGRKSHRCRCGANVFRWKHSDRGECVLACNACGTAHFEEVQ